MQRRQHPAWRSLAADASPLVASFLHRVFVVPNVRVMAQSTLAMALEDTLYGLREQLGTKAFLKSAQEYLNDWAANAGVRLGQERIGFEWVRAALAALLPSATPPTFGAIESERR
jgi:hypothetical protein